MSGLLQEEHCGELSKLTLNRMLFVGRVLVLNLAIRVSSALDNKKFFFGDVGERWG